jgi:hypothetical protein
MSFQRSRPVAAALLATLLLQTACMHMEPVEAGSGAALADTVEIGALVRVLGADGRTTRLRVTAIDAAYLTGTTPGGEAVRLPLEDLREVSVRELAPGRTAALVLSFVGLRVALDDLVLFPQ